MQTFASLWVAISARRGEQRVAIPIEIARRDYLPRSIFVTAPKGALLELEEAVRDGRRLLALLATESPKPAPGLLLPPVDAAGGGFGEYRT